MYSVAAFKTSLFLLSLLILTGCMPVDEVAEKSQDVGFEMDPTEVVKAPVVQSARTLAENPINAALPKTIVPTSLSIPSIGVEAPVQHLGENEKGEMAVPNEVDEVSWFEPGYIPGQKGRAVIAGHVDGIEGPAIFWDLSDVQAGDTILVSGDQGQLTFEIYKMESIPLDLAEVSTIFGPSTQPELILITCSGLYDRDRGTREQRLVVYAKLIQTTS